MLMGNDKIFFHIEQILHRSCSYFSEFRCKLLLNCSKKLSNGITFACLDHPSMASTIPVTVSDFKRLIFNLFLLPKPLFPQPFTFSLFLCLPLTVGQKARLHCGIFAKFSTHRPFWV
uniref:Uncharacterized protein MANES_11G090000 n=1 Tax=Rhizophora mucronata TaxID=61149 RepID=A0A2P2L8Q9_RHIMU